jgi:hypothetical protein
VHADVRRECALQPMVRRDTRHRDCLSVEVADAGTKSGTHRILIIGRGSERPEAGDIGLSLEEAKTLISVVESYEHTK